MGIRFACPNGHPLHVKAELAGRRGICPECKVRFVIPAPETAAVGAASTLPSPPAESQPVLPPQPQSAAASEAPPPPAETSAVWYVRPTAGGQYGPADDDLLKQWAAEGRIAAEAYVWKTGWENWRRAGDLPEQFPHLASSATAPQPTSSDYNRVAGESATPSDVSLATARYQRRRQRSARGQMVAAASLIVLAVILAGVLVWVVRRTNAPVPEATERPATPPAPAAAADEPPPAASEADTPAET